MSTLPAHVTQVAPEIYQVHLPLPFALNRVNVYLLRDPETSRWTIVDTGLHTPQGEAAWRSAFEALNIGPGDVEQIILTHMHPDHFGMAGWLQGHFSHEGVVPPVLMSPVELAAARRVWIERAGRAEDLRVHMRRGGVPEEHLQALIEITEDTAARTAPHPQVLLPIQPGTTIRMGGRTFAILQFGGHSDGQILFYDRENRLMLCGDHILNKITPNIGLWHDSTVPPLETFLASLDALVSVPVDLALPGHKTLITNWQGRIEELRQHHALRLQLAREHAHGSTAFEISDHLFPNRDLFTPHEMRFAIAEALAHLEYLRVRGAVTRSGEDVWQYTAV
ncbi:MAG: MBL fold metallo-hydrolase [Candidatus Flexifilum sp.]